jgi:hypothetical protein
MAIRGQGGYRRQAADGGLSSNAFMSTNGHPFGEDDILDHFSRFRRFGAQPSIDGRNLGIILLSLTAACGRPLFR